MGTYRISRNVSKKLLLLRKDLAERISQLLRDGSHKLPFEILLKKFALVTYAMGWKLWGSKSVRGRRSFFSLNVQTESGAYAASYSEGLGLFPVVRR